MPLCTRILFILGMVDFGMERSRIFWWILGILIGILIFFTIYSFIGTIVFGLFIYYSTRPIHRRLEKYIKPKSLSASLSLIFFGFPFLFVLFYTALIVLKELNRVSASRDLGVLQSFLNPYIEFISVIRAPSQIFTTNKIEIIQGVLSAAVPYIGLIGNILLQVFIMFVVAYYLLKDDDNLYRWIENTFGDKRGVLKRYIDLVDDDLYHIFFGNLLNIIITTIIGVIAYNILNFFAPPGLSIPYAALLGVLAGIASLIPIIGMKIVYIPVTAYLFLMSILDGSNSQFLFTIIFFFVSIVIVDIIPDLVLRPYVSGRELHLGLVMFSYLFGPLLFGWYGIFLGPILLVFTIHFVNLVLPYLMSGKPIEPTSVESPLKIDKE